MIHLFHAAQCWSLGVIANASVVVHDNPTPYSKNRNGMYTPAPQKPPHLSRCSRAPWNFALLLNTRHRLASLRSSPNSLSLRQQRIPLPLNVRNLPLLHARKPISDGSTDAHVDRITAQCFFREMWTHLNANLPPTNRRSYSPSATGFCRGKIHTEEGPADNSAHNHGARDLGIP